MTQNEPVKVVDVLPKPIVLIRAQPPSSQHKKTICLDQLNLIAAQYKHIVQLKSKSM
jgi:hypothetical protein